MNIAMITLYLPSETKMGVGYQAHALANALIVRGHSVTMFSPCAKPDGALYDLRHVDVGTSLRTFRFAWNLRKVDFTGFDIIHAHGDNYWLWSRRQRPPVVRTMHGSCLAEAIHIPRTKEKLRMAMLGISEILATIVADATVCVSENTRWYYPWVKRVIPNGIDLGAFSPGGRKEVTPTILFVGTYSNRKRGKLLMEIFARDILPALPVAQLWMVCSDAPPAPGVTVLGRISQEELVDRYRRAWVFCLPSTYEGFGIPYIEAMAAGTAVVASPNVGAVEVTRNGQAGLIPADDKLGAALLQVLRDETLRHRLQAAGLERVKDFSFDVVCAAYEKAYAAAGGGTNG